MASSLTHWSLLDAYNGFKSPPPPKILDLKMATPMFAESWKTFKTQSSALLTGKVIYCRLRMFEERELRRIF
jgi:hypothetical protein